MSQKKKNKNELHELYDGEECLVEEIDSEQESEMVKNFFSHFDKSGKGSPNFLPLHPKKSFHTIDKISNTIQNMDMTGEEIALRMEPRSQSKISPVTTRITLEYKGVEIKGRQKFTSYDTEVLSSIVTLYMAGNTTFTCKQVWQTMIGKPGTGRVSEKQLNSVRESIDKMSYSELSIDAREEFEKYGYNFEEARVSGNLLHLEKVTFKLSGNKVEGYHILRKPILLEYAIPKHQILSTPIELLRIDTINNTETSIVLIGYLLRRINSMQTSKLSRVVLCDTIYKQLNLEEATRQKKQEIREMTKKILDYWISMNFINGYELQYRGKKINSFLIDVKEKKGE